MPTARKQLALVHFTNGKINILGSLINVNNYILYKSSKLWVHAFIQVFWKGKCISQNTKLTMILIFLTPWF